MILVTKISIIVLTFIIFGLAGWKLSTTRKSSSPYFSPWTSKFSLAKYHNESIYNCPNCSWNTYSIKYPPTESISLLNDEKIPQETPPIVCLPESFGYKLKEAQEIFPDKNFPLCSELVTPSYKIMDFDIDTNLFTMNCGNSKFKGKYVVGEDADSEVLGIRVHDKEIQYYEKPVKLRSQEFVYGTCDKDKEKYFENAIYKHRPKRHLIEQKGEKDPLKIIVITLDSVSRRSFFRKMPETVKFLNNITEGFSVFDMKIHNVMGEYSAANIVPMLIGDHYFKMHWEIKKYDMYKERAIWTHARRNKFATLFIEEGCTNDLARYLGKEISVDHIGTSFWCAARRFNDFENNSQVQRCIGLNNSHAYVYNYIEEFSRNYKHLNQWIFTHVNTAHESSGLLISTMDLETLYFLQSYLTEHADSKTILFITGDHGMRYGEWFKKLDGSHEHRLPLGLIIASNKLLNSIPFSIDTLSHNSQRLTSKLDLYTTQLHLIKSSSSAIEKSSKEYADIKRYSSEKYNLVSLLLEKIPNNRTCFDIGIPAFWCSCLKFIQVTEEPNETVLEITQILIDSINEESFRSRAASSGMICKKLTLGNIQKLWVLSTDEEYYKIQFDVNEQQGVLFESVVLLTWKSYKQRRPSDSYQQVPFYDFGKRTLNIMYVRRVDSYAGECEHIAKRFSIRAEICICNDEALERFG